MDEASPVIWIKHHIATGIDLREECRSIRSETEIKAWETKERLWAEEAIAGAAAMGEGDEHCVKTLDHIKPIEVPVGHPYYEARAVGLAFSSTGEGLPGNNPLSCHARRIDVLKEIAHKWEQNFPSKSGFSEPTYLVATPGPRDESGKLTGVRGAKVVPSDLPGPLQNRNSAAGEEQRPASDLILLWDLADEIAKEEGG